MLIKTISNFVNQTWISVYFTWTANRVI